MSKKGKFTIASLVLCLVTSGLAFAEENEVEKFLEKHNLGVDYEKFGFTSPYESTSAKFNLGVDYDREFREIFRELDLSFRESEISRFLHKTPPVEKRTILDKIKSRIQRHGDLKSGDLRLYRDLGIGGGLVGGEPWVGPSVRFGEDDDDRVDSDGALR
ncbi:MAG: hypothetical protein GY716_05255 [bacterium]|nr:hypothetical protein [bacterium]